MRRFALLSLALSSSAFAQMTPPRMPANPDLHGDKIAFSCEGDIWIGDLKTNKASRLTTFPGLEDRPRFSPDGKMLAFDGVYDGARQVYVVNLDSADVPRRVTYDPSSAVFSDWTLDGKSVIYRSGARSNSGNAQFFTQNITNGWPMLLPMWRAGQMAELPGNKVVFNDLNLETHNWKRYRGGMANDLWFGDLTTKKFKKLTTSDWNDMYPVAVGKDAYFVGEMDGSANLYRIDTASGKSTKITNKTGHDVTQPQSDGTRLIYRFADDLFIYDPVKKTDVMVKMELNSDRIHARNHELQSTISSYSMGAKGQRIVVAARGQLFSVPTKDGDIRPIANKIGTESKLPAYSPNGKHIAFVSDRNDEQNVWITNTDNLNLAKQLSNISKLPIASIQWAPNSEWLLIIDSAGTIHKLERSTGKLTTIAKTEVEGPYDVDISADSRFVAFSTAETFNSGSVYIYDDKEGKTTQITKRPFRDGDVAFDKTGRYLYFIANRNVSADWDNFDFQMNFTEPSKIAMVPLTMQAKNPFLGKVDEETAADESEDADIDPNITYDLEDAGSKIVFLPIPAGNYGNLQAGKGIIYFTSGAELKAFRIGGKQVLDINPAVASYDISAAGDRVIANTSGGLMVGGIGEPLEGRTVSLGGLTVSVNPPAEWRQILRAAWRHVRDTFYDPKLHGADWEAVWARAEKRLESVGTREELNILISEMQAEVNVSHMFNGGGYNRFRAPSAPKGPGVLGIDYVWDGFGAKITDILTSDGYELDLRSPLGTFGTQAKIGETILKINDAIISAEVSPEYLLRNSANQWVKLSVSPDGTDEKARTIWVKAWSFGSEGQSRYYQWTEANRAKVNRDSKGRFGYIHLPDMQNFGMQELTKHLYANLDKEGLVIDVRYNGGGITSGMVLERLRRVIFEYDQARYGKPNPYHRMGVTSKLVMICNENTGSDGEYFGFGWRQMKLGPSVGKRTWGGYMAVSGTRLIDGGSVSSPVQGSFAPDGKWLPDGYGFKPDFEVEITPEDAIAGKDPQMDKAIALLEEQVKKDYKKQGERLTPPIKPR